MIIIIIYPGAYYTVNTSYTVGMGTKKGTKLYKGFIYVHTFNHQSLRRFLRYMYMQAVQQSFFTLNKNILNFET